MSDLTIYAEALIATVARAFYEDEVVCLIDVLIRDKFLRDDDMSPRLNLPAKRLRSTLQFLQEEHLVRTETVDDLSQGGSQATKFYSIDYNRAVHSIRLRIYLLRKKLLQDELHARSQSYYLCPGYSTRRCNGRYTEEEAQHCIDPVSCLFICQECNTMYVNDPNKPSIDTYTLKLVDNTKELRTAIDNLRHVNVQFSSKFIGNHQIRPSMYDLLQKVRGGMKSGSNSSNNNNNGGGTFGFGSTNNHSNSNSNKGSSSATYITAPITSNLPSENFALGIGSKRLAGTGRTAGIKEKKLLQQGVAQSAAQARNYLVGGTGGSDDDDDDNDGNGGNALGGSGTDSNPILNASGSITNGGGSGSGSGTTANNNTIFESDLLFLKNAMGNEIQFTIERGGAARAQLLVSSSSFITKRKRRNFMDAAASRVGSSLPIHIRVQIEQERKRKRKQQKEALANSNNNNNSNATSNKNNSKHKKSKLIQVGDSFDFLKDNIGRANFEDKQEQMSTLKLRSSSTSSIRTANDDDNSNMSSELLRDENNHKKKKNTKETNSIRTGTLTKGMMMQEVHDEQEEEEEEVQDDILVLLDDTEELQKLSDEKRLATFQKAYMMEMERQEKLVQLLRHRATTSTTTLTSNNTSTATTTITTTTDTNNNDNDTTKQTNDKELIPIDINNKDDGTIHTCTGQYNPSSKSNYYYNNNNNSNNYVNDNDSSSVGTTEPPILWEDGEVDLQFITGS